MKTSLILISDITCPECGFTNEEKMSENSCLWFYECTHCKIMIKPLDGDCCVFCSYGSEKCPPVQADGFCCN
ncbi:MAG: GDCCVxC domain-containing (seleno)protein [Ignavibacteria bacterium]